MPPDPLTPAQAHELVRLWRHQALREEALGKALTPVPPAVARIEGRPYFKLEWSQAPWPSFLLRKATRMAWPVAAEEAPFYCHLLAEEKKRKKYRVEAEREFMIGFPAVLAPDKGGRKKLTSFFKFPLSDLSFPPLAAAPAAELVARAADSAWKLELRQEEVTAKIGEMPYLLDELFLNEDLGLAEEAISAFRKAISTQACDGEAMIRLAGELLLNQPITDEDAVAGFGQALQRHVAGSRLQVYPYGLLYELDSYQPTAQLQKDLAEVEDDEMLSDFKSNHPLWHWLRRENPEAKPDLVAAGLTPRPLTPSQQQALGMALVAPYSLVQGPPGTGKTEVIRATLEVRLIQFMNSLQGPEDRALDLDHCTLVTSTNNRAVDNALEGLEQPGQLPCTLRLGSRQVLQRATLPLLTHWLQGITATSAEAGRQRFKALAPELKEAVRQGRNQGPTGAYALARELHQAWLSANQNRLLELGEALIAEITDKAPLKSLKRRKNLELLLTAFPLVGCTLLSLRNLFDLEPKDIGLVVIDEAGQCNPAYVLPALVRAQRAVILGDVNQLEPISRLRSAEVAQLASQRKIKLDWEQAKDYCATVEFPQSAQGVAQGPGVTPLSLKEHFRCHPKIIGVSQELCGYDLEVQGEWDHGPALFYQDVTGAEQAYGGSWLNESELDASLVLVRRLLAEGWTLRDMAILTPYRGQLYHLRERLNRMGFPNLTSEAGEGGPEAADAISLGTVHRFQGGERSIVIFNPVICQGEPRFLNSRVNLLNVALSRAKARFYLIGSLAALHRGQYSAVLAKHLAEHGHPVGMF